MAQNSIVFIPHIVINPSSICSYSEVIFDKPRSKSNAKYFDVNIPVEDQKSFINSTRKNNGTLSANAKRKVSKAIEYLNTTATEKKVTEKIYGKTIKFKTTFITLTLPSQQQHPDSVIINKCLNSFLIEIIKFYNVKNYIWRAETQYHGNIHFHILADNFIPWNELRNRWNRIINKLGYVDRFHEKHGHKTPNSTTFKSS